MKIFLVALSISFLSVAGAASAKKKSYIIIGGGLSGLAALDELVERGQTRVDLYEASDRFGGRVWTQQGPPLYERGAELVNSTDSALIGLLKKYKVDLVKRRIHREQGEELFLFRERVWTGEKLTFGQLKPYRLSDLQLLMERNPRDRAALKRLAALKKTEEEKDAELRRLGAREIVKDSDLVEAILAAMMRSEYGMELTEINASTLLECFEVDSATLKMDLLPGVDEMYRVRGGSDTVVRRIVERHVKRLHARSTARSVKKRADGLFEVSILAPGGVLKTVLADHVIMAVPAPMLKQVRIEAPGLSAADLDRAGEMPFAHSTKVFVIVGDRFWRKNQKSDPWFQGSVLFETGFQMWETTEDQDTKQAVLTAYSGDWPASPKESEAKAKAMVKEISFVPGFEKIEKHVVKIDKQVWPQSYAGPFTPGYPDAPAMFGKNFGGLVFVGSDKDFDEDGATSMSFAYMDGAVRSGRRGVERLLQSSKAEKGKDVSPAPDAATAPASAPL